MATDPRFPVSANCPIPTRLTTGNTAKDGTGTVVTLFTAGTADSILYGVFAQPSETSGAAQVVRLFLNNGSTNATATNNILWAEFTLPNITASETLANEQIAYYLNRIIPANHRILATISATPTNPIAVYAVGEDY